jgi:hypothetical protein
MLRLLSGAGGSRPGSEGHQSGVEPKKKKRGGRRRDVSIVTGRPRSPSPTRINSTGGSMHDPNLMMGERKNSMSRRATFGALSQVSL